MINKLKRGVTVTSLVVYIVLFSSLTLFLSATYTDLNERLFLSRGNAINYTTFNKLQYNLINSAKESNSVTIEGPYLAFSNGETADKIAVIFNANKNAVNVPLPAGEWNICVNGEKAGCASLGTAVDSVSVELTPGVGCTKVTLNLKLNKYMSTLEKSILVVVEE